MFSPFQIGRDYRRKQARRARATRLRSNRPRTSPIDYQWYENGSPIDTSDNPSAATADLSITTIPCISDTATYHCVITGPCGSVTTDTATLRACFADLNCDGFVNGDDYDAFASLFEPGDSGADLNCDTFVNGDDYDLFASAFEAGC